MANYSAEHTLTPRAVTHDWNVGGTLIYKLRAYDSGNSTPRWITWLNTAVTTIGAPDHIGPLTNFSVVHSYYVE